MTFSRTSEISRLPKGSETFARITREDFGERYVGGLLTGIDRKRARRTVVAICGMLYYQGYTMAINGIGAPWIAKSFNLGESGIARLYAWISISAA